MAAYALHGLAAGLGRHPDRRTYDRFRPPTAPSGGQLIAYCGKRLKTDKEWSTVLQAFGLAPWGEQPRGNPLWRTLDGMTEEEFTAWVIVPDQPPRKITEEVAA